MGSHEKLVPGEFLMPLQSKIFGDNTGTNKNKQQHMIKNQNEENRYV